MRQMEKMEQSILSVTLTNCVAIMPNCGHAVFALESTSFILKTHSWCPTLQQEIQDNWKCHQSPSVAKNRGFGFGPSVDPVDERI